MTGYASYDRPSVRFERRLRHPVDAVWRSVTEPAELGHWFPARVALDGLRVGARITFTMDEGDTEGEVIELEAPRRFAFTWGDSLLTFDLEPLPDGCLLRFSHHFEQPERAARDAAGWHVCLDAMEERLAGAGADAPTGPGGEWRELYDAYQRRGFPAGAEVPE